MAARQRVFEGWERGYVGELSPPISSLSSLLHTPNQLPPPPRPPSTLLCKRNDRLAYALLRAQLILQPDDVPADSETDKHVLLTIQPRIPAGSLAFAELPAGMLDDSGSFGGAAAEEIAQETGLEVDADALTDLTALVLSPNTNNKTPAATTKPTDDEEEEGLIPAMFPSAGGCDEFVPLFLHQRRVARAELADWQGRLTGLRDQGEKITLRLVRLDELWREGARDSKALAAWALYEGLRREGRL